MVKDDKQGVSLSPKAMVDSVAEWPLHLVVDHLRKKEKDSKDAVVPSRVACRSTIKLLTSVIGDLATRYGVSRSRMCRWLSYHGVALAREDITITRLSAVYAKVRQEALLLDDADTIDIMNSMVSYSPRIVDDSPSHLYLYEPWVSAVFDDMSLVCGVHKYHIVQVFLLKSVLSGDVDYLGETVARLVSEVARWDKWMGFRLAALERLMVGSE